MSLNLIAHSEQIRLRPSVIACEGSAGVEGSLKRLSLPAFSKTKSVKVPPVSTPIRIRLLFFVLSALYFVVIRRYGHNSNLACFVCLVDRIFPATINDPRITRNNAKQ